MKTLSFYSKFDTASKQNLTPLPRLVRTAATDGTASATMLRLEVVANVTYTPPYVHQDCAGSRAPPRAIPAEPKVPS